MHHHCEVRSDKLDVMLRLTLKGIGLSISDILAVKGSVNEMGDHERTEVVWSWNGNVYANGKNGHKLKLYSDIKVDYEPDKAEAQANTRDNAQDNARSNARISADAYG